MNKKLPQHKAKIESAVASAGKRGLNGFNCERQLIEAGLKKLGLDGGYEIVIADSPDLVENTAAEELQKYLGKAALKLPVVPESKSAGKKRFLLGREPGLKALQRFGAGGALKIRGVAAEDDGFHLKRIGADFVVAGANPRGVLYGVFALQDFIAAGAPGDLDIRKIPHYRKRGGGPHYSFNEYVNLATEDFPEEKAACLARLGINQLTDQGVGYGLHEFVQSDVFPFQTPPRADFQRKVRAMSALCKKYGIDQYLFLSEPMLAKVAADPAQYPPEALGTVNRPWGNPRVDRTLCVQSPIVREHLRGMMRKLVREYPDLKGVQMYNMDGASWLCTPALCDRCKVACADSPANEYNPWETQAGLVTLLAEAAQAENPEFDFRFWGAAHYHGERFAKLIRAARGYSSLCAAAHSADRNVMVPAALELDSAFVGSREICKERAVPLYLLCEFNNLESVPRSLPFPFHVCAALKKIKRWEVKCLTEIYGLIPEHNSINALAAKEFQWNPDQDPERFLAGLALRQFGEKSGKLMVRAWREMQKAFAVWDDWQFSPLTGSQHYLSIGTAVGLPPPILPDIVQSYNGILDILVKVLPWLADDYRKFREPGLLARMARMNTHLAQAAHLAQQAIPAASDREFIGICHYAGAPERPTCKEYAELNYAPIAVADALCRQRCHILRAYHLLTDLEKARQAGDKKKAQAQSRLYRDLIREDIGVQERFCELLAGLAEKRPCYTRASLTEHELSDLLSGTRAKLEKLKVFLEAGLSE